MARSRRVGSRRSQITNDDSVVEEVEEIEIDEVDEIEDAADEVGTSDYDDYTDAEADTLNDAASASEAIDIDDGEEFTEDVRDETDADVEAVTDRVARGSRRGARAGRSARGRSADESDDEVSAGRSNRRGGRSSVRSEARSARSSARGAGKSAKKRKVKTPKSGLTQEELEARRRTRKTLLNLCVGLLLLAAVAGGLLWVLKPNPLIAQAEGGIGAAKQALVDMNAALNDLDPDAATKFYDRGMEILHVDMFANGGEKINPSDPKLASVALAQEAGRLVKAFDERNAQVPQVRNRVLAEKNLKKLTYRLQVISTLSDDELNTLQRHIKGFRNNPLDPELGDINTSAQGEYASLIARLLGKEQNVELERSQRLERSTTGVQKEVNSAVNALLGDERFQEALDHIDAEAKKWPKAQLSAERERVINTAKDKWSVAKKNAEGKYADGISATNSASRRKTVLAAAVKDMDNVMQKFGIAEYVSEARDLKAKYETALRNLP